MTAKPSSAKPDFTDLMTLSDVVGPLNVIKPHYAPGKIQFVAIRPILTFEHPVLREKAKKVARVDMSIQRLIDDLAETRLDAPCAGLAANQIGVALRVCVVKGDDNQIWGLVNPEIVKTDGVQVGYEGCLSYPGWVGEVARHEPVVVKARNRRGKEVRIKASGFTARAFSTSSIT